MKEVIAELKDVSRTYDGGRVTAIDGVCLRVERGEFLALTGVSGSGKSTLLFLLGGLERPTAGTVAIDGRAPVSDREWARLRATRIGFVFQSFNLLPTMTALENVQVPMFGVVSSARRRKDRAARLLERVGLADRRSHLPAELSGGQRQRVAIARALANSPAIILADEPTGNLDSKSSEAVLALLEEIHAQRDVTVITATHDREVSERAMRRVELCDGRIRIENE